MAGAIYAYETKNGTRYRIRYRKPDGTPTTKRGFTTKRDAKLHLANIQVTQAQGTYLDPAQGRRQVQELAQTWLNGHLLTLKKSSQNTMETAWRIHVEPEWGTRQVASIRKSHVTAWIGRMLAGKASTGKKLSAQTIRRAVFVLSLILEQALEDGIINTNPARGVKLPAKTRKPVNYLTHKQVELLATSAEHSDVIRFLAYTGVRWGEMSALRVKHVNLPKSRITIESNVVLVKGELVFGTPKTGETRVIAIPEFLTFTLRRLTQNRPQDAFVFGTDETPIPHPHAAYSWFVTAVKTAQTEDESFPRITPHDLRHTAASLAVSAGANVKTVQRMLGHASAAMTLDVYADLFDEDLDNVATRLSQSRHAALTA